MKPLTKYILLFSSLLTVILPQKAAKACGFSVEPGEYRFWILQPDLVNQPDLSPFFFASTYLYKPEETVYLESYPKQNVEEWFKQIKRQATADDIETLLEHTRPDSFFTEQNSIAKRNSFLRFLLKPENKELYRYMSLSKKTEDISGNPDPWEERKFPRDKINNIIEEAKALYQSSASPFIKLRTAYQLVRLYGYNGQDVQLHAVYDTWIAPVKSNSWIKSAALYQKAFHTPGLQSDYLLSKVFDRGDFKRSTCLMMFESKSFDKIVKLAKNNHERNVLTAMKAFNYPGRSLSLIKEIYATEPAYKELPFLLLREINKVEDWLLTNKVSGFTAPAVYNDGYYDNYSYVEDARSNYHNDRVYTNELYHFLQRMLIDNKSKQQSLLHLYTSHLALLMGNFGQSAKYLDRAKSQKNIPPNVRTQIRINTYLLHLESGFRPGTEKEFISIVNTPDNVLAIFDPVIMKDQLILYTGRKMIKQGDRARGLMLLGKTNRALGEIPSLGYKTVYQEIEEQATENDYDQILNIIDKDNKTSFEKFISNVDIRSISDNYYYIGVPETDTAHFNWNRNKILDYKSSWYIRKHRLKEALETLKKIPANYWKQYPYTEYVKGNAFYVNVYHANTVTKGERQMNKVEVVNHMIYLQQLASTDKTKAALCYFQLANAWYNMTYYGKNWLMVRQWLCGSERDSHPYYKNPMPDPEDYYGCRQAKLYYQEAIQATKDKKLAALCYFMLEDCEDNSRSYHAILKDMDDKEISMNKRMNKASKWGIDLSYYKSIIDECEQYQSFIKQYNKQL